MIKGHILSEGSFSLDSSARDGYVLLKCELVISTALDVVTRIISSAEIILPNIRVLCFILWTQNFQSTKTTDQSTRILRIRRSRNAVGILCNPDGRIESFSVCFKWVNNGLAIGEFSSLLHHHHHIARCDPQEAYLRRKVRGSLKYFLLQCRWLDHCHPTWHWLT
jgi:hypothetical protein